jgi:hypothetical protein
MRKGVIRELAQKANKPVDQFLIEAFQKYGSNGAVANALGVDKSTISLWLLRANLESHTIVRRRTSR